MRLVYQDAGVAVTAKEIEARIRLGDDTIGTWMIGYASKKLGPHIGTDAQPFLAHLGLPMSNPRNAPGVQCGILLEVTLDPGDFVWTVCRKCAVYLIDESDVA